MNQAHGSPYDCGASDAAFWKRPKWPHYREPKTWRLISRPEMTEEQIKEYETGYENNQHLKGPQNGLKPI